MMLSQCSSMFWIEKDFKNVKKYLDTQRFYSLKDKKESYASAAKIYFRCRKKGVTINSTIALKVD